MKILISGGAGFLGSNFSKFLLGENHQVWVVDNLLTGSEDNIAELKTNKNFTFIKADVIDEEFIDELGSVKFDVVYHLASPASPPWYQKYPIQTLDVNSKGTKNMLEVAKRDGAKFIYASTSEVYGDPLEHPQKETYWGNVNSFGARACYDEGKRFGEALCYTYLNDFEVDVRVVRIFNTYGPNMDPNDGRVVSNFIVQALKGQNLTVYGDGTQTRSFCFVKDLIKGFYLMATTDVKGEVVNLGNPKEFNMLELAELVKEVIGGDTRVVFEDLPQDDPKQRRPDISKAKELLNWVPEVDLETGLKETIEYFRNKI
jgi:UDP-glucuronate decarboxylase